MMYSRHLLDVMNLILHSKEFSPHHSPRPGEWMGDMDKTHGYTAFRQYHFCTIAF